MLQKFAQVEFSMCYAIGSDNYRALISIVSLFILGEYCCVETRRTVTYLRILVGNSVSRETIRFGRNLE